MYLVRDTLRHIPFRTGLCYARIKGLFRLRLLKEDAKESKGILHEATLRQVEGLHHSRPRFFGNLPAGLWRIVFHIPLTKNAGNVGNSGKPIT